MKLIFRKMIYLVYFLPVIVLAYLFWKNTAPSLVLNYDLSEKSSMLGDLVPEARVGNLEKDALGYYKVIKSEPVYFDVRLPRKYDAVKMEIKYSDLENDIFETGVSRDSAKKSFDFVAIENKILDNLRWNKVEKDDLVLYQRKNIYKSADDFLNNPPAFDKTLVYKADVSPKIGAFKSAGETIIDFPVLQGLKLAVYHQGGVLDIKADADGTFDIGVYNSAGEKQDSRELPAGLYKINITGPENIIFNKIHINSQYVTILDGIKLGKLEQPLNLYLAGGRLLALADKALGAQELNVAGKILDVKNISSQYKQIFENIALRSVFVPKGNIELGGTLFFINKSSAFYPRYENFYSDVNLDGMDFILARYSPPKKQDGMTVAEAEYDIRETVLANGKLRFLLSLPNASQSELVKIRSIKLEFQGEKFSFNILFQKLMKLMKLKN